MGTKPKRTSITVLFTVVDIPHPTYNGIIGRTMLTTLSAIVSPIHLMIKFPTRNGIGCMRGNQRYARVICPISTRSNSGKREVDASPKFRPSHPEILGGMMSSIHTPCPSEGEAKAPRGYVIYRMDPQGEIPLNRFLRKSLQKGLEREEEYKQRPRRCQHPETSLPSSFPTTLPHLSTAVRKSPRWRGINKGVSAYEPSYLDPASEKVRQSFEQLKVKENPKRCQGYQPLVPEVHTPGPARTEPTYLQILVGNPRSRGTISRSRAYTLN